MFDPASPYWTYTEADVAALGRYRDRTVKTIGPRNGVAIYRDSICPMAFEVSYYVKNNTYQSNFPSIRFSYI
jgi:hypothetical protein